MPDYKRKKVKKTLFHKNSHIEKNDIEMESQKHNDKPKSTEKRIKVVKGLKFKRKKIIKFFAILIAALCISTFIFSMALPGGLYENVINITSLMGHGKYPLDISGSTVLNTVSNGSYYYVLTDTSIIAYSNNGKTVLNDLHGFSNPIISVSKTRALVYDQGGKSAYIYNLNGRVHTYKSEYEIITANIAQDGTVAFATHSDKYTSVLNVYDKKLNHIFTWNSAKEIINNVLINNNGNRVALSTFDVVAGQYVSKMQILNLNNDSADPEYTLELGSSLALSLTNTGRGISVICADKYKFVHWSKFNTNDITISGEINIYRSTKKGLLLVSNRPNNRADNTIILISNSGKKYKEFKIDTIITDIQYSKGRVYYISDTNVQILDKDGNILREGSCAYGSERFAVIAPNSIATVCDRKILKIDIQKGEN